MLGDALKTFTAAAHAEVHRAPFLAELLAGRARPEQAIAWLRALCAIHRVLERQLAACSDEVVARCWDDIHARWHLFEDDLGPHDAASAHPMAATAAVVALVDEIRDHGATAPHRLLGVWYVLEGSTLGGVHLGRALGAILGTPVRCLAPEPEHGRARFEAFRVRLDAAGEVLGPRRRDEVVAAAVATFRRIGEVARGLEPDGEAMGRVNPDAGSHAVTSDPREVVAAFDAGAASWARCPYYGLRYGDRGRRFTRSDSLWLVRLATHRAAQQQIEWLAGVLSSRGMPSVLLESHLLALAEALTAAVPRRAPRYARLRELALGLRARRVAALPEPEFDAVVREVQRTGAPHDLGTVVAGAIADQRSGRGRAAESVGEWLARSSVLERDVAAGILGILERRALAPA